MSFQEKRQLAKERRRYVAQDGTVFLLRPVRQNEFILAAAGANPGVLPVVLEMQQLSEEERLQRVQEILDQKGGAETLLKLSERDDYVLRVGIQSPPILADDASEAEVDAVGGMWISDFKALYPEDWPKILERINELSGVSAVQVDAERFQETPDSVSLSGEGVRQDPVGDSV